MTTKSKAVKNTPVYTTAQLMTVLASVYTDVLTRATNGERFTYATAHTLPITLVTMGISRTNGTSVIDDAAKCIAIDDVNTYIPSGDYDAYLRNVLSESKYNEDKGPESYIMYLDEYIANVLNTLHRG